jgi:AcrR family transcriptional regulator
MDYVDVTKRMRGRPRSLTARSTILSVTNELLQTESLRDVTAEAIAKKAGVSKATLYKWWPNKTYIAFDAFMERVNMQLEIPNTGSAYEDFLIQVRHAMSFYLSPEGRTLSQLMAEGHGDANFHEVLLERFLSIRREAVSIMWVRGVARGEIRPDIDMQIGLDIIYGPLMFRFLSGRHTLLSDIEIKKLIATVFQGIAPKPLNHSLISGFSESSLAVP